MKFLTSFFVAALCVSTCGIAQTTPGSEISNTDAVSSASGSTYVGSMTVTTTVPSTISTTASTETSTSTGTFDASKPTKGTRTTYEIFIFRSGNGQVEYQLNLSSIRFDDPEKLIDGISTPDLFNFLGNEGIRQGVALGYTSCSGTCDYTVDGKVWSESYVKRVGSGSDTRFSANTSETLTARGYSACRESGSVSPTVSLVSTTTTQVSGDGLQ